MPTNQIRDVSFGPVAGSADSEGGQALFIALDVPEPDRLLGFLEEVVARFKRERMAGPADARFMLITVTGEVPAADFARAWQASIANDAAARALLGMLHQADVMQGDAHGWMVGQASLIAS